MRGGLVVVASASDKRSLALRAAIERVGFTTPTWLSWNEAIANPERVGQAGPPGAFLRVDSPGSDPVVWHALASLGGSSETIPHAQWRPGSAWFAGLVQVLQAIDQNARALQPTHPSGHILTMTDKWQCQKHLERVGVRTPPAFLAPPAVAALRDQLAMQHWPAVFVKPRYGSSGAGVLAWRRSGVREQLTAAAVLRGRVLINDKHLHTYTDRTTIDRILSIVIGDAALVQRWIPKAGVAGGPFDLRVLVIDGVVAQRVARVGRGPITNLHLDASRADPVALLSPIPGALERIEALCHAAARSFPGQRCLGLDVLLDPRGGPWVLECNAWGDFLPGLLVDGLDSYELQMQGLLRELAW